MPGNSTVLGPFSGGINTVSDEGSTSPNEVVDCVNFDIKLDGYMVSRPPITKLSAAPWATNLAFLGYLTTDTNTYMLGSLGSQGIYKSLGETNSWSIINPNIKATAAAQYLGEMFFVNAGTAAAPSGGGKWDGTTFTLQPNIPLGNGGIVFKDRMWVFGVGVNASRLYWSKATDLTNWTTGASSDAGFVDVSKGDGSYITAIVAYNDNILIFKTNSTWILSFSANPGLGTLRMISASVGATNTYNIAVFESILYVLYNKIVYTLSNNFFSALNVKVPFKYDISGTPFDTRYSTFLTTLGPRLICRYYNKLYVFHIRTGVWTRYETLFPIGPLYRYPVISGGDGVYYAASCYVSDTGVYRIKDGFNTESESMICKVRTRTYDMDDPSRFKRLFWWGADLSTIGTITATSSLIDSSQSTLTHLALRAYTHLQLSASTHQSPTVLSAPAGNTIPANANVKRKFVKFLKGQRFRQIYFTISMPTDGTSVTSPVALYTLRAFIGIKEKVVQQVT